MAPLLLPPDLREMWFFDEGMLDSWSDSCKAGGAFDQNAADAARAGGAIPQLAHRI